MFLFCRNNVEMGVKFGFLKGEKVYDIFIYLVVGILFKKCIVVVELWVFFMWLF